MKMARKVVTPLERARKDRDSWKRIAQTAQREAKGLAETRTIQANVIQGSAKELGEARSEIQRMQSALTDAEFRCENASLHLIAAAAARDAYLVALHVVAGKATPEPQTQADKDKLITDLSVALKNCRVKFPAKV